MASFKRASTVLFSNSGNSFETKCSLVLKVNPRWNAKINLMSIRNNTADKAGSAAKKPAKEAPKGIPYKNLTIGVPKEIFKNERRVAMTPTVAQNLSKKGFKVIIEENAGALAKFPNDQYEKAGAKISDVKAVYSSDIILKVRAPEVNVR